MLLSNYYADLNYGDSKLLPALERDGLTGKGGMGLFRKQGMLVVDM